jgi:polysaccharide biosynthesis protein PslH
MTEAMATSRLSVLSVTSEVPWPLDAGGRIRGGRIRTFHLQRALAREFEVRLVVPMRPGQESACDKVREHNIQVIQVPTPTRRAWREAARALRAASLFSPYVLYRRHANRAVLRALAQAARQKAPDVLYLDHLDSYQFRSAVPHCQALMDLHNVYSLVVGRLAQEQRNPLKRAYLCRESTLLRNVERRAAKENDLLFTVSAVEARHYQSLGARAVALVPNGVDCPAFETLPCGRVTTPPNLLFIGTMSWGPNANAALFLIRDVLPRIRQACPNVRLWIVGRDPPSDVHAHHEREGVVVTGGVPDVLQYFRDARCLLVPLESGGGTRLKILEAFAAGLPVVSTEVGVEGIDAENGRHLSIVDREEFASTIIRLLGESDRTAAQARAARQLVRDRYDWTNIGQNAVNSIRTHLRVP